MIQNENINEHKLHFKASMPNGFWIKKDRSFRMEKMGVLSRMFSSRSRKGLEFLGLHGKHNSSSHGTGPGFYGRPENEHTAQDFAAKELDLRIGWLSRGKTREFGRAYLPREVRKDLSAWKCVEGDKSRFTQTR